MTRWTDGHPLCLEAQTWPCDTLVVCSLECCPLLTMTMMMMTMMTIGRVHDPTNGCSHQWHHHQEKRPGDVHIQLHHDIHPLSILPTAKGSRGHPFSHQSNSSGCDRMSDDERGCQLELPPWSRPVLRLLHFDAGLAARDPFHLLSSHHRLPDFRHEGSFQMSLVVLRVDDSSDQNASAT